MVRSRTAISPSSPPPPRPIQLTLVPRTWLHPDIAKHNGKVHGTYIGIIDFLQPWNTAKVIAHCIKEAVAPHPISTIAPTAYAKQFSAHFATRMSPTGVDFAADQMKTSAVAIAGAAAGASPTRVAAAPEGSQRKRVKDVVFVTEV